MTTAYKAELVEWVDSSGDGSWHALGDAVADTISSISSIGWVIGETETALTLAQSIDGAHGSDRRRSMVDNTVTIPKVAITSRKVIRGMMYAD